MRQVCSIYGNAGPFDYAQDVKDSAEVAFFGLRTPKIQEAMKSVRDAQTQASDTVRQSVKSSQDLVKSATERFIAGLVAVGATLIANSAKAIDPSIGRDLMLLVAGFFLLLALASVVLEGPLLGLQMKNLPDDLKAGSSSLPQDRLKAILNSGRVHATRSRIRTVRIAIPLVYVLLVAAIVIWGDPADYV